MEFKLRNTIKSFNPAGYVKEVIGSVNPTTVEFELIDCSLGVNPFGFSSYIDSFNEEDSFEKFNIGSYPQFMYSELKKEVAKYWQDHCSLTDRNIRVGTGSVGILTTINKLFIEKGTRVLGVAPTFTTYSSDVGLFEGIFEHVLLGENDNFKFNVDKFISRINHSYTLIYIDNPNNPTGQIIGIKEIRRVLLEARENNICVIIDEAYGDFMDNGNSAINLINDFDNLMVVRTFSKGFGLAGLRIGYMIANDYLSEMYSKVDQPFTLNNVGNCAAIKSIKDREFILSSRKKISEVKQKVRAAFEKIIVLETDNEVPIMTLEFPDKDINLFDLFRSKGVLTESGEDFTGLGKNFVRMRVPSNHFMLSEAIKSIENKLS